MSLLFSRNLKFVNLKTTGNKIVLSICWLIEKMISNYDCKGISAKHWPKSKDF